MNWWQSKAEDKREGIKLFKMTGSTPQFLLSSMADKVRLCSGQKNTVEHLFNFCQRGEKKPLKTAEKIYVKFLLDIAYGEIF